MINAITFQNLRNPEFLQFNTDALTIVNNNDPAVLKVTEQFNTFQAANAVVKGLFITDRSSPITEDILAMDLRRDNAINGIISYAQAHTYHFDATTSLAANVLNDYFATYGPGVAKQNYASETATLSNIVADVANKPNLSAAAATLQLGDWFVEMDTANTIFNEKYMARTQEYGAANTDTMKAKRLEATNAFYDLRDNLNAYYTIYKGAEPFATAIKQLNALIAQYNNMLAVRNGIIAATTTPPTAGTTPSAS